MKKWGILYAIADRRMGDEKILEALLAGVDMIQLREKGQSAAEYLRDAKWMREQTDRTGTLFLVNDRLDIALASGADLPVQEARRIVRAMGRPDFLIGATARTAKQAGLAFAAGADYIGSGAWYETRTKEDASLLSEETYLEIRKAAPIPNVAIGGLTPTNCLRPLRLGASGIAAAGGLFGVDSVTEAIRAFRERLERAEG